MALLSTAPQGAGKTTIARLETWIDSMKLTPGETAAAILRA
jgi:hypothetical protein